MFLSRRGQRCPWVLDDAAMCLRPAPGPAGAAAAGRSLRVLDKVLVRVSVETDRAHRSQVCLSVCLSVCGRAPVAGAAARSRLWFSNDPYLGILISGSLSRDPRFLGDTSPDVHYIPRHQGH